MTKESAYIRWFYFTRLAVYIERRNGVVSFSFRIELLIYGQIVAMSVPTSLQSSVISGNLLIFKAMQSKKYRDSHLLLV